MIRWLFLLLVMASKAQSQEVRPVVRAETAVLRPIARPEIRYDLSPAVQTRAWMRAEVGLWARPPDEWGLGQPVSVAAIRPTVRPYLRPDLSYGIQTRPIYRAEVGLFAFSPTAIGQSPHPQLRPASIEAAAEERRVARLRGQVCGDVSIQGDSIGHVAGNGACGIDDAVRVRSVAGVTLQPQATMDCQTATALKKWVEQGAIPAVGGTDGGVESLRIVSHYSCRTRNNLPGARLSEHSYGRAIDIAGVGLQSGREITVLTDWNTVDDGARLRQMWQAACRIFGTVLGPEANQYHRDHFHFDTARYRSGSYCR